VNRPEQIRIPAPALELREDGRVPTLGEIGLDHFAPYLLNRIVARWNADLATKLKEHGLNTIQMRTLAVLSLMSGATVNELSVYTVTEQSTMSRSLDGMEADGLVRRRQREADMRVREIHVTEKGREAFREFWPEMHEAFGRMFAGISEAEYETMVRILTRVLRNIRQNEI
jgi:DNA-binding MarR family transcriptional regulator